MEFSMKEGCGLTATAIINLIVSIIAARYIGLHGVLLGTVIARLTTQVWYDAKLIFKLVFKENVKKYYLRYILYSVISIGCCALGWVLCNLFSGAFVKFMVGGIFAVIGTLLFIILLFRKSEAFNSSINYAKLIVKRGRK